MSILLTPNGRRWIEGRLTEAGAGTVPELIAALIAVTPRAVTKEDIQVELSAIETDVVNVSLKALSDNKLLVERI